MTISSYLNEGYEYIHRNEYAHFQKKIIDLAIDTNDVDYFQKVMDFIESTEKLQDSEIWKKSGIEIYDDLFNRLNNQSLTETKNIMVSCKNLTKSYDERGFQLQDISIDIYEGEIIGLVGENGNGKTTLLRLICGELVPNKGTITYHFSYQDDFDLKNLLTYIPQRTPTWKGTLYDNLQFTAACHHWPSEMNRLICDLYITRFGLRPYRFLKWSELSSGYKMRFELVRTLLRKPKIMLIDEPLANLDINAQQTILNDFKSICKSPYRKIALILSSQQLYEVEKTSDTILYLEKGQQKAYFDTQKKNNTQQLIIEADFSCDYNLVMESFKTLPITEISQNGGIYFIYFDADYSIHQFLHHVAESKLPLTYCRNISESSRRFFIQ